MIKFSGSMVSGKKISNVKGISAKKKKNVLKIISGLKEQLQKLHKLEAELDVAQKSISPQKTRELIEEIKVPSLETLLEEKTKKKAK